jgi:hypothetical protein
MVRWNIYNEVIKALDRETITKCAERNGELPFGYVIDYLKDMYRLSKPDAWWTAVEICNHFGF